MGDEHALDPAPSGLLAELTEDLHIDGQSAFTLLRGARESLRWRIAVVESATVSLDIKYFIWKAQPTGSLLISRIIEAAQRGVRVRLLVDDLNLADDDRDIAALDATDNISIKLFNPTKSRNLFGVLGDYASAFHEMNRRMHNKMIIADGHVIVLGGRNIADEYFGLSPKYNFLDLDFLAAGSVVPQISTAFDAYWNADLAKPISQIAQPRDDSSLDSLLDRELAVVSNNADLLASFPTEPRDWRAEFVESAKTWHLGTAYYIQDDPVSTGQETLRLAEMLERLAAQTQEELIVASGYLLPTPEIFDALRKEIDRGVRVRLLTGTMEAINHTPVYAHYRKHIDTILDMGAELYELDAHPQPEVQEAVHVPPVQGEYTAIHLKAIVGDRKRAFLGSLNIDPRALVINTEGGLYIESDTFAAELTDWLEVLMSPDSAWQVSRAESGQIQWTSNRGTRERSPDRGRVHRALASVFSVLPIEDQL